MLRNNSEEWIQLTLYPGSQTHNMISTTANYKRNQGKSFGGFNLLLKDPHMVIRVDFLDQLL